MMTLNEVADEEVYRFKDYVTTTWVDDIEVRFPIELWSQYDNVTNNQPRRVALETQLCQTCCPKSI